MVPKHGVLNESQLPFRSIKTNVLLLYLQINKEFGASLDNSHSKHLSAMLWCSRKYRTHSNFVPKFTLNWLKNSLISQYFLLANPKNLTMLYKPWPYNWNFTLSITLLVWPHLFILIISFKKFGFWDCPSPQNFHGVGMDIFLEPNTLDVTQSKAI